MSDVDISIEKLIRVYTKMREKRAELTAQFKEQDGKIEEEMRTVKGAILDYLKEIGAESLKTESGIVYRTVRTTYTTNDWESMNKFILEHGVPELLEKRLHQTNMKVFLEENPDVLPPGLNSNNEYSVTVRRK